jgi:hypothetical protein
MPLLPSHTLILTHSLTSLLASYALLTSPSTLLSSSFTPVWMLGEAMHIREPLSTWVSSPSEPVAAAALILALAALMQGFFASGLVGVEVEGKGKGKGKAEAGELGEKVYRLRYAQTQWMGMAGIRVLFMGLLVMWTYVFQGNRNDEGSSYGGRKMNAGGGFTLLANRAVFSAAMMDMLFWGYLWTNVREEGRELAVAVSRLREETTEDELLNS